ncbi:5'-3' exonuclease [Salinicoccus sp. ID82-1]|uniref:5'-3' exonuclease n=1 Tax=Salinicoccus cyprini TaxID=2493691 RepID=A0A558AZA7_9STAP|nr:MULTISPECIES: 5'-3' exonuclease [Salinicoccus]MCG1009123.1 5'-3' exonuclease [Salinicoccus sp. ID82-1]TVT29567.1 5'-3' exonuclease [Salinicoccus cyprini]
MNNNILVVDGMALLFRHFYATSFRQQFMYNVYDRPTNGVQGVVRHVLKLVETLKPEQLIITWDMGSKTVRNDWYADYKKDRVAPPDELIPQFDHVKEVLDALGMFQIGMKGYEADDIIGTLSKRYDDIIIVSGDKDLLQLLDDRNELWLTKKGYTVYDQYTRARFEAEHGITPAQFIDVKALMGDASDGYKGVKGIGEKTAFKLIREFESVENILMSLDTLTPAIRSKIESDVESLKISQRLARIITDVPVDFDYIEHSSVLNISKTQIQTILDDHDLKISSKFVGTLDL